MELWKPVPGYEGYYEVSDEGRVRALPRTVSHPRLGQVRLKCHLLKQARNSKGYLQVTLYREGRGRNVAVQILVLEAFVSPRPEGLLALHRDDDSVNNVLANLYWGTPSENMYDRVRNGGNHNANKTMCPEGHPLSGDNLVRSKLPARECRTCSNARQRRARLHA